MIDDDFHVKDVTINDPKTQFFIDVGIRDLNVGSFHQKFKHGTQRRCECRHS